MDNRETPPKFSMIVAADNQLGIGKGNTLPWKLPEDMKYFKRITTVVKNETKTNAVIMGRKTWESIPPKYRPLPHRTNIVVTKQKDYVALDAIVCNSILSALMIADKPYTENIFIIGGGQLYKEVYEEFHESGLLDKIYITRIERDFQCDTFFPSISDKYKSIQKSPIMNENDTDFYFEILQQTK